MVCTFLIFAVETGYALTQGPFLFYLMVKEWCPCDRYKTRLYYQNPDMLILRKTDLCWDIQGCHECKVCKGRFENYQLDWYHTLLFQIILYPDNFRHSTSQAGRQLVLMY